jgi:hypothetical protein
VNVDTRNLIQVRDGASVLSELALSLPLMGIFGDSTDLNMMTALIEQKRLRCPATSFVTAPQVIVMGPCLLDYSAWLVFIRVLGMMNGTWAHSHYKESLGVEAGLDLLRQVVGTHGLHWPPRMVLLNPFYLDVLVLEANGFFAQVQPRERRLHRLLDEALSAMLACVRRMLGDKTVILLRTLHLVWVHNLARKVHSHPHAPLRVGGADYEEFKPAKWRGSQFVSVLNAVMRIKAQSSNGVHIFDYADIANTNIVLRRDHIHMASEIDHAYARTLANLFSGFIVCSQGTCD